MLKPMLLGLMLVCAIVVLALCWLSFKLLRQSQQQSKAASIKNSKPVNTTSQQSVKKSSKSSR